MDDLKELRRKMAEITKAFETLAGESQTLLFKDFANEYLKTKLSRKLRPATLESFEHQVKKHLIPAFGNLPIERINNSEWLYWVEEKRKESLGRSAGHGRVTSFFNARKCLSEILWAAKEDGHIERFPKLDVVDEPHDVGRVLEDKEVHSILWHCLRPFRFIFYVFWKTGCRPREILRWEWYMFRWKESGSAWIDIPARISKTGKPRSIPLNKSLSRHLRIRFERGNHSPFVFPHQIHLFKPQLSYHAAYKSACRRAGVLDSMPYDFRRTFITKCAAEGLQMLYVAKILGTSLKMIEKTYAKTQVDVMESIVK